MSPRDHGSSKARPLSETNQRTSVNDPIAMALPMRATKTTAVKADEGRDACHAGHEKEGRDERGT
jgi:hypothetical protein